MGNQQAPYQPYQPPYQQNMDGPYQQPYQSPYQPYEQGYQPPIASTPPYQENGQQYSYPQPKEEQPQAEYPEELPPMQQ